MKLLKILIGVLAFLFSHVINIKASDTIRLSTNTLSNPDYHNGQLSPAIGVHNIQVMRANREHPETADGFGWTYNHAPMLAYWNNTFYLEYLSDSVSEHVPPGHTLLVTSKDGYHWAKPVVVFPRYKIPDGTTKPGIDKLSSNLYAVMHQRMGFYVSKENRLLVLAFYGFCLGDGDSPNDGYGVGRVIREVYADGTFGPIYFIRYNPAWNEKNTSFPFYTSSKDKGFKEACNEIISNPLILMQWVEESDRNDPLIPLKKQYKAFCYYHLPDGRVVGLWKHALTSISDDGGKTWEYTPVRAPGFVNANAKIWGQRTSDGLYATVYNPSMFRWPLGISVSKNGLDYANLLLVQGEISHTRYGGHYKQYGPQYVRGILEGNGTPPDSNLWVTYSMNKEDIWVAMIPVPVKDKVIDKVNDVFDQMPEGHELDEWNMNSPLWAPVKIGKTEDGKKCLQLSDWDRYDFARAERIFPASHKLAVEFSVIPAQNDHGILHIELQDAKGSGAVRIVFDSLGICKVKDGYRYSRIMNYNPSELYHFNVSFDTKTRSYTVNINGKDVKTAMFYAPVESLERIVYRTGEIRRFPDADSPPEQSYDLPNAGEPVQPAIFNITYVKTTNVTE